VGSGFTLCWIFTEMDAAGKCRIGRAAPAPGAQAIAAADRLR